LVVLVPSRLFGAFMVANGGTSRFGAAALSAIATRMLPPVPPRSPAATATPVGTVDPTGAYRLTRYAHRGVENLPALFNGQLHVNRIGGDTIDVSGLGDASGRYVAVARTRWQKVDGTDVVAVRLREGKVTHFFGSLSYFGTRSPAAYERLAWFDEPHFLNEALSYVLVLPVLALLAWPITVGGIWLVRRRRAVPASRSGPTGNGRVVAVVMAITFVVVGAWFGFGFIAVTNRAANSGGGEIIYGLPPGMQLLAWAPLAIGILAAIVFATAVAAWRRRWWSIPGLVLYTVIATNAMLFFALLVRLGYFPVATG
jgi:hypothetical protein